MKVKIKCFHLQSVKKKLSPNKNTVLSPVEAAKLGTRIEDCPPSLINHQFRGTWMELEFYPQLTQSYWAWNYINHHLPTK